MPLYLYGLMRSQDGPNVVEALPDASLQAVEHEGVCALVTDMGEGDLALRRESALAHTDTLQAAFEHGPVLPVRFGTLLPDTETLRADLLAPRATAFLARLEALDGLAEMQLKVNYLEQPLLQSILGADPGLTQTAMRIQNLPAAATHFERIQLGESIHREVEARRQTDSQRMVETLQPMCVAVSVREPRNERAVLAASFLVARERLEEFDAEVQRLSEQDAERMSFRLIGPMPAHSFAEGDWEHPAHTGGRQWG